MSDLIAKIQAAQREAGERAVIAHLEQMGLTQPAPITSESGNQAAQGASAITSGSVPLLSQAEICDLLDDAQVPDMPDGYTGLDMRIARIVEKAVRSKLGAGVPMTREDRYDAFTAAERAAGENISPWSFDQGVRAAERHHGIVGKEGGNVAR